MTMRIHLTDDSDRPSEQSESISFWQRNSNGSRKVRRLIDWDANSHRLEEVFATDSPSLSISSKRSKIQSGKQGTESRVEQFASTSVFLRFQVLILSQSRYMVNLLNLEPSFAIISQPLFACKSLRIKQISSVYESGTIGYSKGQYDKVNKITHFFRFIP